MVIRTLYSVDTELFTIQNASAMKDIATLLTERVVRFSFRKNDGSIRKAVGTLMKSMTPKIQGGGRPTPEHLQLYFDVEKQSWRSFNKNNLIEIEL